MTTSYADSVKELVTLAKTVAEARQWHGRAGGWVYTEGGTPLAHGWHGLGLALAEVGYIRGGRINWRAMDVAHSRGHLAATVRSAAQRTAARGRSTR